jgi:NADH-quinone oxidoreductase subunit L
MQLWLIPVLPLAGFLINGLLGRRFSKGTVNAVAIGSVALSFAWVLKTIFALGALAGVYSEHYFTWIRSGGSISAAISASTGSPSSCCWW